MTKPVLSRREFAIVAAAAGGSMMLPKAESYAAATNSAAKLSIETFNDGSVKLGGGRWKTQYEQAREFYFGVSNDDILHGFRAEADLPAPGKPLGGWAARNSGGIFGQWLSGMSRMYRYTGDEAIRDKAIVLFTEWAKTVGADGNCRMRHYPFEKLVCGLVDLKRYAGQDEAIPMLAKVTDWASKTFDRERAPAAPRPAEMHSGKPLEWYTLSENQFRAFETSGDERFKSFAEVWLYPAYWNKFAKTSDPSDAYGVHAYSHVNTHSSAAMAYAVTGDTTYLDIIKNAYDFLQNTQCYATGGFGPVERIMPTNGNLGKALNLQMNTCETPCCSWAAFKLARYLMTFTGESRYGDWIERLLYNGIGAALPITGNGKNFYYADYRVAGGVKYYARSTYTCCSGTYIQAVADYHNLVYFKDDSSLYVNLFLPSEVAWKRPDGEVKVTQKTAYPEAETTTLTVNVPQETQFALKIRVPGWCREMAIQVNGAAAKVDCEPGKWAVVDRRWKSGDQVEIKIPLPLRYQAVDRWHPDRVAVVRGPVVLVQDAAVHEAVHALPANDEELNQWLVPAGAPGVFRMQPPDKVNVVATFQPFYAMPEVNSYRMYFDRNNLPYMLWWSRMVFGRVVCIVVLIFVGILAIQAAQPTAVAPEKFCVRLETTKGNMLLELHRDWAPHGVDRFYELVNSGYYDGVKFNRVIAGKWAQFGINGDPKISKEWREKTIPDDHAGQSNVRGTIGFAFAVPNGRTTQLFINLRDNSATHDREPFVPIGKVVEGMEVADKLYADYGESAGGGIRGGQQQRLFDEGNAYLDREFPQLDSIRHATIIDCP